MTIITEIMFISHISKDGHEVWLFMSFILEFSETLVRKEIRRGCNTIISHVNYYGDGVLLLKGIMLEYYRKL